ncbi:MAG: hypothetical protein ACREJ2_08130 [Planctomycetota bacterium]
MAQEIPDAEGGPGFQGTDRASVRRRGARQLITIAAVALAVLALAAVFTFTRWFQELRAELDFNHFRSAMEAHDWPAARNYISAANLSAFDAAAATKSTPAFPDWPIPRDRGWGAVHRRADGKVMYIQFGNGTMGNPRLTYSLSEENGVWKVVAIECMIE